MGSEPNQPTTQRGGVVLVADDDFAYGDSLRGILELAGHSVLVARDGGEAIRLVADEEVDVVILDMNMPVDGWFVLRELAGRFRPAVIINSGETFSPELTQVFFEARPFGILAKPTAPPFMLAAVNEALVHVRNAVERHTAAEERDLVADERDAAAEERDRVADERDAAAEERDRVADDADWARFAEERTVAAKERERVAIEREIAADERRRVAGERTSFAEEGERLLKKRRRYLDAAIERLKLGRTNDE